MGTGSITIAAGLVAAVGLTAVLVGARRWPGPVGVRLVATVVGALGAATLLAAVVVAVPDRPRYLYPAGHLAYLVLCGAVPATALVLGALAVRRRGHVVVAVGALLAVGLAPVGWYASHIEPYRLRVDRATVELPAARAGDDPIRIGVLADLQTTEITSYEEDAVDRLLAERPDLILVPGDLFQGTEAQLRAQVPAFRRLLGRLQAPADVFAVRGDQDPGRRMDVLLEGTGVRILDDEVVTLRIGDRTVRLGGNRLLWAPVEAVAVREDLGTSDPADVRILVAHRPDAARGVYGDLDVDLTVAGHTHGGQVAIPGFGPLVTFSTVSRRIAAGGLHELNGHPLYVSTGVGMARGAAPQIRLFSRPSIGIITLR